MVDDCWGYALNKSIYRRVIYVGDGSNGGIENPLTITKLAKFNKLDFTKAKLFRIDFLTSRVKEIFIHLYNTFSKILIFKYFNPKCHI